MRTSFYIGIAVAALTLAGCTVGPNYKRPQVAVPESFRAPEPLPESQGASLADLKWFEVFRDPQLDASDQGRSGSELRSARCRGAG